ncbi:MAG: hypothetical protein HQL30_07870 [Candidatus Omnitrophica bacterium]|nr:hypothetical protein [Candidatus Omnitrophota bacterium]
MKKRIVISNRLRSIKAAVKEGPGGIAPFFIDEVRESSAIRGYLGSVGSAEEARARDLVDRDAFAAAYSRLIYRLNKENSFRGWWAMDFTSKNPLHASLCKDVFDFLCVKKLMEKNPALCVLVVTDNVRLACFIRSWAAGRGIHALAEVGRSSCMLSRVKSIPFVTVAWRFVTLGLRQLAAAVFFNPRPGRVDTAIIEHFIDGSFDKDGAFRNFYFGGLSRFLDSAGKKHISCGYTVCRFSRILRKKRIFSGGTDYPLEYFASAGALPGSLLYTASCYRRIAGKRIAFDIDGEDISPLLYAQIAESFSSGQVLLNNFIYHCVLGLSKRVRPAKILYPFENRSWEKMVALAAGRNNIPIYGYQHAALIPKHVNFIMEQGEEEITPLPLKIISTGKITGDMFVEKFGFRREKVITGCALRQVIGSPEDGVKSRGAAPVNLLVTLASNLDEYVRAFRFLDSAGIAEGYNVTIRPHPGVDINKAFRIYTPVNFRFTLDTGNKLGRSLGECDIVVYASSTCALEAVAVGVPAIYLDFGNFLDTDPMFGLGENKWICRDPRIFKGLIKDIMLLDPELASRKKEKGIAYAREYFREATAENMKVFIQTS